MPRKSVDKVAAVAMSVEVPVIKRRALCASSTVRAQTQPLAGHDSARQCVGIDLRMIPFFR